MSQFKTVVLAVAAAAGITAALVQHFAGEKVLAENRDLMQQNQKLAQAEQENKRLSNLVAGAGQPSLSKEQAAELLRLRGEVGRLRSSLRSVPATTISPIPKPNPPAAEKEAAAGPAQPFTAKLTARVGNGQTLVTGGWSTAPGKRTFMLMTPTIKEAATGNVFEAPSVSVKTCTMEIPETMLTQFALDQFSADGRESSVQQVLPSEAAKTLFTALKDPIDGVLVTRGIITTGDGIEAQMYIGESEPAVGSQPNYTIGLTPNLTSDGNTVVMSINTQVMPPRPNANAASTKTVTGP